MEASGQIFNVPLYIDELGLTGWGTELAGEPATIVLDEDAFVIGRRKELAWKSTDTGVITDGDRRHSHQPVSTGRQRSPGNDADGVGRYKNPVNRLQPVKASRYPAGVLTVKARRWVRAADGRPAGAGRPHRRGAPLADRDGRPRRRDLDSVPPRERTAAEAPRARNNG